MTDKELRLAFDQADTALRHSGEADELFEEWHLTILCVQAETEWRKTKIPIREKLARSRQPFDFDGVAFVLRKPDLIVGFHKWATATSATFCRLISKPYSLNTSLTGCAGMIQSARFLGVRSMTGRRACCWKPRRLNARLPRANAW